MSEWLAFFSRHPMLSAGFFGVLIAWVIYEIKHARRGFQEVSGNAAALLVNRQNAVIVDVSPAVDFEKQHIPGARNMPMSQFDPDGKELSKLKGQALIVTCRDGSQSALACKRLLRSGYTQVHVLRGGVNGWLSEQLPTVKGRA